MISLLADAGRPVSAVALHAKILAIDPRVHTSALFRKLGEMMAADEIERVELLSGYRLNRPAPVIALLCRSCGNYREVPDTSRHVLVQIADATSFVAQRYVVEVNGICSECVKLARDRECAHRADDAVGDRVLADR